MSSIKFTDISNNNVYIFNVLLEVEWVSLEYLLTGCVVITLYAVLKYIYIYIYIGNIICWESFEIRPKFYMKTRYFRWEAFYEGINTAKLGISKKLLCFIALLEETN